MDSGGHVVLGPGQSVTCAGSGPTSLPVLEEKAWGEWARGRESIPTTA